MDDYPYDLGSYSMSISATGAAQLWFDRGLNWTYGFNHDEAVRCFKRAAEADPSCAMAHWGIAYATGPNYNMEWSMFDDRGLRKALGAARAATEAALALLDGATAAERALIEALPQRYPQADPLDDATDMVAWDHAFAHAMQGVQARFPDSLDIRAMTVEALMQLTPWAMWDLTTGEIAEGAETATCKALLEDAFSQTQGAWRHPGLLHLYVHLMEMSPTPEAALRQGDVLRTLVPDAGHLVHMPTHIDVLCGVYSDVVHWNSRAVEADLKYYDREGAFNIYTGYRQHNYHFVAYGAMFMGQYAPAAAALRGLAETTPEAMLKIESPPMADYFESYVSLEPHLLVRFGKWREALDQALPDDPVLYCSKLVNVLYSQGVAHAALGDPATARRVQDAFLKACDAVPDTRLLHTNTVVDLNEVAKAMLEGEILYREGKIDAAFAELHRAAALESSLNYDEPWGWMQPVRHALGALMLEQGDIAGAEAAFRADLGLGGQTSRATVHPDNVWALRGLHDCLAARGESAERAVIAQKLAIAQARSDQPIRAACGCAQAAMAG